MFDIVYRGRRTSTVAYFVVRISFRETMKTAWVKVLVKLFRYQDRRSIIKSEARLPGSRQDSMSAMKI